MVWRQSLSANGLAIARAEELSGDSRRRRPTQRKAREDLAVVVDDASRDEAESLVETGWTAVAKRVAGEKFGGTSASDEFNDLSHYLMAVAKALVTVVDK